MALETIIIGAIAIGMAAASFAMMASPKSKQNMKKNFGDLSVTRAEEGQVVPIVYGTVRVPGSIIWYGNPIFEDVPAAGAKGFGGASSSGGYNVYLDVHFVLCEGKITLEETYKDEEEYTPEAALTFNDGTNGLYEAYAQYAGPLTSVAHIYYKGWFLGKDTYSVPSLSFKVKRVLTTPLTNGVTTGENPACVVWDLLSRTNATLDQTSFEAAAVYFNGLNMGLNICFNEQQEVSKMLDYVFAHVGLILYREKDTYYLKLIDDSQTPVFDIPEEDVKDLAFSRVAYNQVFNDIAANYLDTSNTQRTVRLVNEAVYEIVGERKNHSYDFNGFNSLDVVKIRLTQMLKLDSYPLSGVTFKTSLAYYTLLPGDVFTLNYSVFGMVQKQFRVTKILKNPFENRIEIEAKEHLYDLLDSQYFDCGETKWTDLDFAPAALDTVVAIQARWGKYREWTGKVPVLILPVKKTGKEIGYDVYYSLDNVSYNLVGTNYTFAYLGQLEEEYPSDTYAIDDQNGILIAFDEDATHFALDDITRTELFTTKRLLVIDSEVMKFQTATDEGANIRLTGILRDDRNQVTHSISSDVLITYLGNNISYLPVHSKIYIKVCPRTFRGVLDLSLATAIEFIPDLAPEAPTRLKATRSGSNITLEIFPNINRNLGCGVGSADTVTDTVPHPFIFSGSFLVQVDSDPITTLSTTEYNFTNANACTVTVWNQYNGYQSSDKTLNIGTDDGEYIS